MLLIGEFSNVGHKSARMLRHYDKIGLLQPAHVDPFTGYRFYEWEQLQVISRIQMLKGYQFLLMRIKDCSSCRHPNSNTSCTVKRLHSTGRRHGSMRCCAGWRTARNTWNGNLKKSRT